MKPDNQQLLPCPFCGSLDLHIVSGVSYGVKCHQCYSKVQCCSSRDKAIKAWNTRAQIPYAEAVEKIQKRANQWRNREGLFDGRIIADELEAALAALGIMEGE